MIGRIRDRATFETLRRQGRRARCGELTVVFVPLDGDRAHFAFGIGRRVGPAVVRNRVRRRLRAAAHAIDRSHAGLPRGAYLVTARPAVTDAGYDQLERWLDAACAAATGAKAPA